MITLAICWKAIGTIAIILGCAVLFTFVVTGTVDLCMSDNRAKKTIGWIIAGVLIVAYIVGMYFIEAKDMCG